MNHAIRTILFICSATLWAAFANAQDDYPNKPIRLITPAAQGGTTDILARVFGAKLGEVFKQQVLVDNRASASGVVAGDMVAKAAPDGYTLLLAYHQHTVNAALNSKLPYHPVNSFTPITQLTSAAQLLVVNSASPPKTLEEFIALMSSEFRRATSGCGMPAGPMTPYQPTISKPGSASVIAGSSGSVGTRLGEVTASARMRPARTCTRPDCRPAKLKWYSLASSATMAGPVPL